MLLTITSSGLMDIGTPLIAEWLTRVPSLDNMLQSGQVWEDTQDANATAIRELNEFIHRDSRVDALLLPFGDGLTLAVKRA